MKYLSILGSTGSIGCNTLNIVEMFPERFAVKALAAKSNVPLLAKQIGQFHPEIAVVFDEQRALELKHILPANAGVEILYGDEGYRAAAIHSSVDIIVTAVVGAAGLMPTLAAIDAGKDIALANKETLVMAGEIVMKQAEEKGIKILPVDSEHSAIFQCFAGQRKADLDKILLTASGGPFLNKPGNEFTDIKPEHALKHPTWQMGQKITIDSATLMNKGLEVIEAKWLFSVSQEEIEVVVHPQSIVHSMVSYKDGSVIAQLGIPDMKGAIAYALSWPERLPLKQPIPDFANMKGLTFQKPDMEKFPCLALAFEACDVGGTLPAVLNAANEVAVYAFLNHRISFTDIPNIIKTAMDRHNIVKHPEISDILEADHRVRSDIEKELF
ncbi:1-deoxy-D-xylulose-5-phosphate reductoisomerase [Desulfonema magnum]|uniref:1-deoxy-D-xylulose 5-phosphate reductoisomerase n=1 Tax=Desulfonema magnum TaxID=45655 RepID=A0A975GTH6_9BACT|nr:1-deoxy-D-xylulose-5-phosphate reductoisomerase [Desulfonema magnum]QTA92997.1 1-deoxy-D-xylulose 5-phosphate reductoisomerase [Desulfonema magnum]